MNKTALGARTWPGWCVLCAVLLSCSTDKSTHRSPAPGRGIVEYREIATESANAVRATVSVLDKVGAQSNACPREIFEAFSGQVRNLQVASIRLRARAQAIQKRGDAFFQNWHESLSRIEDPQMRERAQRFRPELQASFQTIEIASRQVAESYRVFSAGLLSLEIDLEQNAGCLQTAESQQLIRASRGSGTHLLENLAVIQSELARMSALLQPAQSSATL